MTEKQGDVNIASFILGLVVAFFFTAMLMQIFGINKWHDRTCWEQFSQAVTASDTLWVIRQDTYCDRIWD